MKQTVKTTAATILKETEPVIGRGDTPRPVLRKRIGPTLYEVSVRFSQTSRSPAPSKHKSVCSRNTPSKTA